MNEIKVTVEYEAPKTNLFDELMRDYKEIEKKSIETANYYKPLADVAEITKLELILKQLETITNYLIQLHHINSNIRRIYTYVGEEKETREIKIALKNNGEIVYSWDKYSLSKEGYSKNPYFFNNDRCSSLNILGNWDKWEVFKKLEAEAVSMLKYEMRKRKNEAQNEINRLKNITD